MPEEILVVEQQLFKAGAGNIHEAQLGLAGGCCGPGSFGDILASTTCSLHHLIDCARSRIEILFAKPMGGIINKRGGLKCSQIPIAATFSDSAHVFSSIGPICLIGRIGLIVSAFDNQPGDEFEI